MPAISALTDVSFTEIEKGLSSSSDLNTIFTAFQTGVNNLNDVMADLEDNYASSSAPADNTVRGKLYADTTNAGRVILKLDPDGSGCDDEVATRLEAQHINFATGGTATHKLMGAIDVNSATATPRTTAGDFDEAYTMPANTLNVDGQAVRVTWWGTKSGASGTFSLQPKLGTANIGTAFSSTAAFTTLTWELQCLIVRTGAATQDIFFHVIPSSDATGSTTLASFDASQTEDLTAALAITLDLTAISAGTVTQEGFIVELLQ